MKDTVGFKEATLTFVCKKLYQHQFSKEDLSEDIQKYYASRPDAFPDYAGGWQPHYVFVGEVLEVKE